MTAATIPPKRPPVFLSQADIRALLSQLNIAEIVADRARIAEIDAARDARLEADAARRRDARLEAIDQRHRRDDVRRNNEAVIARLRREIVGDPIRQYWDQKIAAAHRDRAAGLELAKIDR